VLHSFERCGHFEEMPDFQGDRLGWFCYL